MTSLRISARTAARRAQAFDKITVSVAPGDFVNPDLAHPDQTFTLRPDAWSVDGLQVRVDGFQTDRRQWQLYFEVLDDGAQAWRALGTPIDVPNRTEWGGQLPASWWPQQQALELRVYFKLAADPGPADTSDAIKLRFDVVPPYGGAVPATPQLPGSVITEALVDSAGGLEVTLPGYSDHQDGDTYVVWLGDPDTWDPTVPPEPLAVGPAEAGATTLKVSKLQLAALADGYYLPAYLLQDLAGNTSKVALGTEFSLVLQPLPTTPPAPTIANPITLDHVREGLYAEVGAYGEYQPRDRVALMFGSQAVPEQTPSGAGHFPFPVDVGAVHVLAEWGAAAAPKTVSVHYTLHRLGWVSPQSGVASTQLDLRITGPGNPDFPDPVNPKLTAPTLLSDSGQSNEIPEADAGKAATLQVVLFDEVEDDDRLEFFLGDAPVGSRTVSGQGPGDVFPVTVPWATIETLIGRTDVTAYYRVRGATGDHPEDNYQQSPSQAVDVSKLPMVAPALTVPNAKDLGGGMLYLDCAAREFDPTNKAALAVAIPDLTAAPFNQKEGDIVTLSLRVYSGTEDANNRELIAEADGGELAIPHPLGAGELKGFTWWVPYDPHGKVTYRYPNRGDGNTNIIEGEWELCYSIEIGPQTAYSPPVTVLALFSTASSSCPDLLASGSCTTCSISDKSD